MSHPSQRAIGPWIQSSTEIKYQNPWIRVREDQVIRPDGQAGIYGVVEFQNEALGVVPITEDGQVILVGQHRYPHDTYSWEIPEGGGSPQSDRLQEIQRELLEETGFRADHWELLLSEVQLSNSVSDESAWIWLAQGLHPGPAQPDGCEELQVKAVAFNECVQMIHRGEIVDSMTIMGILMAQSKIQANPESN